jgi:hypothetical protein
VTGRCGGARPFPNERRHYWQFTYQRCRSTGHFCESSVPKKPEEEELTPAQCWSAIHESDHKCDGHIPSEKNKWQYAYKLLGTSGLKERNNVSWNLEETDFASQQLLNIHLRQQTKAVAKQQPLLTCHATVEGLLEGVFSMQSGPRVYNEDH